MDVITFPENLLTTSGLSILLHGVISLPDVVLCSCVLYLNDSNEGFNGEEIVGCLLTVSVL